MRYVLSFAFLTLVFYCSKAQDSTLVLSTSMFNEDEKIALADTGHWVFKQGHDSTWANPAMDVTDWQSLRPTEMASKYADKDGRIEGWFRTKIKLDSSFIQFPLLIIQRGSLASDIYFNGKLVQSFGSTGYHGSPYAEFASFEKMPPGISLPTNKELVIAVHFVDYTTSKGKLKPGRFTKDDFVSFAGPKYSELINLDNIERSGFRHNFVILVSILGVFSLLFWFFAFLNNSEGLLFIIAATVTCFFGLALFNHLRNSGLFGDEKNWMWSLAPMFMSSGLALLPVLIAKVFNNKVPKFLKIYLFAVVLTALVSNNFNLGMFSFVGFFVIPPISLAICGYYLFTFRKTLKGAKWAIVAGLLSTLLMSLLMVASYRFPISPLISSLIIKAAYLSLPVSLLFYVGLWLKEINLEVRTKAAEIVKVVEEKEELLASQNQVLEQKVSERTVQLSHSLENLKSTQAQLIQFEKMASLGELTAGIAHEIQNPLNFVNNFSEVSAELVDEMKEELAVGNSQLAVEIAEDIKRNLEKINHHGKRADAIVKGMLEHSRAGKGEKAPTDLNSLADEYLRLSYHGLRAKDKSFTADFATDLDPSLPKVSVVASDIGRVLLNLINNAFYACAERSRSAVNEKSKKGEEDYSPKVLISSRQENGKVVVSVQDNGLGIPEAIKDKIFQPFFTTKPTGQGTGLGLSLSYDIVKAHGGEIKVESEIGKGTTFTILLNHNPSPQSI